MREEQQVLRNGEILITKYNELELNCCLTIIFTKQYAKYPAFYLQWITDSCDNGCQIIIVILMIVTLLRVSNYFYNNPNNLFLKVFPFLRSFLQYNLCETQWTFLEIQTFCYSPNAY